MLRIGILDASSVYSGAQEADRVYLNGEVIWQNTPAQIDPIVAYSFDEGTGTVITDNTGNGYNGSLNTGSGVSGAWVEGHTGGGIGRTTTGGYSASLSTSVPPLLTDSWTAMGWVRRSSATGPQTLLIFVSATMTSLGELALNNGAPEVGVGSSTWYTYGESLAEVGDWIHLALVATDTGWTQYANGEVVQTGAEVLDPSTGTQGLIGGCTGNTGAGYDDLRIYSGALTQVQVQTDMAAPVS